MHTYYTVHKPLLTCFVASFVSHFWESLHSQHTWTSSLAPRRQLCCWQYASSQPHHPASEVKGSIRMISCLVQNVANTCIERSKIITIQSHTSEHTTEQTSLCLHYNTATSYILLCPWCIIHDITWVCGGGNDSRWCSRSLLVQHCTTRVTFCTLRPNMTRFFATVNSSPLLLWSTALLHWWHTKDTVQFTLNVGSL